MRLRRLNRSRARSARARTSLLAAAAAVGIAIAVVLAIHVSRESNDSQSAAATATPISVSFRQDHPGRRVPGRFLGLSFELFSLPTIARYGARGDLVTMLRSLGPGVLRFGGASADTRVAWTDSATPLPAWASAGIRASDLRRLRRLASRSDWHILLTIGLAHYDPRAAAREAAAAKTALGGWLTGIELGNEPDAYGRHGLRSAPWTLARYDAQVASYRRAIERAAPGIALAGPDVSGSLIFRTWGHGMAVAQKPALLTGHHYPLGCHRTPGPTIGRLLSPKVRRAEDASLHRYLSVAHAGGIRFRLDETNSVSCGGRAGISDTFASTLWAVDYIARTMAAGAVGINLQGNPANCHGYTPVCAPTLRRLTRGSLSPQPEWYALLLSRGLVGERPIRATVSPSRANIDVVALLGANGKLQVVIVDDDPPGSKHVAIALHPGRRYGAATVLSLTGPSPSATAGVLLGGRAVAGDGSWRGPAHLQPCPNRGGAITLDVPPSSAMLVTIPPA